MPSEENVIPFRKTKNSFVEVYTAEGHEVWGGVLSELLEINTELSEQKRQELRKLSPGEHIILRAGEEPCWIIKCVSRE